MALKNKTAFWPCTVSQWYSQPFDREIPGIGEASMVALGASKSTQIHNFTDHVGQNIWYLGSPSQSSLQDYQAKTLATTSQCQPMTLKQCGITYAQNNSQRFQCNENFVGDLSLPYLNTSATGYENQYSANVGLAFSANAALTDVTGRIVNSAVEQIPEATIPEMYRTNPLYYGAWAFGFPGPNLSSNLSSTYMANIDYIPCINTTDPAYCYGAQFGGLWMLNCSTTVYDLTYTWVNGSVASYNTSLASTDMAALLTGPFVTMSNLYINDSLYDAAIVAGAADNSVGIANLFADEYGKLLLAYVVPALEPELVQVQQNRTVVPNVARVPLVPLYLLLATKAIYVIAVIVLAIAAYAFTHPAETEIVKDQLTIKALTSAHFDRPDVMQKYAVDQLQYIDPTKAASSADNDGASKPLLQHAATAPPDTPANSVKPEEPKIGLIPAVDGTWQWVVKADGVWNTVKPFVKTVVKTVVLSEAQAGSLGDAGNIINAYTGKPGK